MVYNYDIYYKTGPKSAQSYRITKTGVPGVIFNGVSDWLYEGKKKIFLKILLKGDTFSSIKWLIEIFLFRYNIKYGHFRSLHPTFETLGKTLKAL